MSLILYTSAYAKIMQYIYESTRCCWFLNITYTSHKDMMRNRDVKEMRKKTVPSYMRPCHEYIGLWMLEIHNISTRRRWWKTDEKIVICVGTTREYTRLELRYGINVVGWAEFEFSYAMKNQNKWSFCLSRLLWNGYSIARIVKLYRKTLPTLLTSQKIVSMRYEDEDLRKQHDIV